MDNKKLYETLLNIAMDVSCIRDMCISANVTCSPIYYRAIDATNKLHDLMNKVKASQE